MVGNKAQKAVAAALTGVLAFGSAAPALAATWSAGSWTRLDGTYDITLDLNGVRRFKNEDGKDRYDTMFDAVSFNERGNYWGLASAVDVYTFNADIFVLKNNAAGGQYSDLVTYLGREPVTNEMRFQGLTSTDIYSEKDGWTVARKYEAGQILYEKIVSDVVAGIIDVADFNENVTAGKITGDGTAPGTALATPECIKTTDKTVSAVVIASGENYPDALAANSLAGLYNAPIILTKQGGLTPEGKALIKFYASKLDKGELKVYIVGGTSAVSAEVESDLQQVKNTWTKRLFGADRQATSLAVAKWERNVQAYAGTTGAWTDTVFITTGSNYADALSASSVSYQTGAPILLTDASGKLSEDQATWLKEARNRGIRNIVLVGGPITEGGPLDYNAIEGAIGFNWDTITPLYGKNRYATSAAVATWWPSYDAVAVATGNNFPDALVGGAFIGARNGILVLADDGNYEALDAVKEARVWGGVSIQSDKAEWLPEHGFILGGTSAVSSDTATFLNRYIQPDDLNTQTDPNA